MPQSERPKVFLTRPLPAPVMDRLEAETDLTLQPHDRPATREEILEGVRGQDALLCLLTDPIDARVLDAGSPTLRIVANYAVGFNNIDIQAAAQRGIAVTNTPGVLTESSADLAFALLLAAARRIPEADRFTRTGRWDGWGPLQFLGRDLHGSTLGLIGMGRIGRAVARRAAGFGLHLRYWNRTRLQPEQEQSLSLTYTERDLLLADSDFVSLHVAYHPQTHHLLGARELSLMKPGSILINTSRGSVVDEPALVAALQEGRLGGAGLDVYEHEPDIHPELLRLDQVVILPHIASATRRTRTRMGMMALENILAAHRGDPLPNPVR